MTLGVAVFILGLPLSLIFVLATFGDYTSSPYRLVVGAIGWLPAALVVCSIAAVIAQRLRWALAAWLSLAIPPVWLGAILIVFIQT